MAVDMTIYFLNKTADANENQLNVTLIRLKIFTAEFLLKLYDT